MSWNVAEALGEAMAHQECNTIKIMTLQHTAKDNLETLLGGHGIWKEKVLSAEWCAPKSN